MSAAKTVLILGANSGIAKALAALLDSEGYSLILAARNTAETEKYSKSFKKSPVVTHFDGQHPEKIVTTIKEGTLDFNTVVYASGYLPSTSIDQKEIELTMQLNYTTPVIVLNAIAKEFEKKNTGSIVGISSVAGDRGKCSSYIYGSAKAGFSVFLAELRHKLAQTNVHVCCIKPGFVKTPMLKKTTPSFLTSTPEEAARCIFKAIIKQKNVAYVKPRWRMVMFIIRTIPQAIFNKMNF